MNIEELLDQAARALIAEIETVRERPSTDLLLGGKKMDNTAGGEGTDYKFETHQPAIRFAEEIKANSGEKEWIVHPVSFEKNEIVLRFPEPAGEQIEELHVEWENDFVLQRTLREIEKLDSSKANRMKRIRQLFEPDSERISGDMDVLDDGHRNEAQFSAIQKSLGYRTVFIWGPPGTGKTSTLGFIIANYLCKGKSVLFASNTNRAVDVGLLSTLRALKDIDQKHHGENITRFGEAALKEPEMEKVLFENQVENVRQNQQEELSEWIDLLRRKEKLMEVIEKRLRDGKQPTSGQNTELELMDQKIKREGGEELIRDRIDEMNQVNERSILRSKQMIATTLAKVCTSDLFHELEFDAVVIDEGSMANLPYLLVLASRARWHRVVVGDPMQLPPIALTDNREAREFLEKDIFTVVSGADSTDQLFKWHDANMEFTEFFDTQYRLRESLADVISTVFYQGRLKTEKLSEKEHPTELLKQEERAYHLIDTGKYNPVLEQKSGGRGFQPVNEVHQEILQRLIEKMLSRGIDPNEIGVMVPFRSPVYDLRNRFYQNGLRDVEVGTIHTFQGREKPYIIFDTIMCGESRNGRIRHYSVRPLDEEKNGLSVPRLLNVAFSRSQKELMILADMRHIQKVYGGKFLGNLLEKLR